MLLVKYSTFNLIHNNKNKWDNTASNQALPTVCFDWLSAFEKNFTTSELLILILWDDSKNTILAAAPLIESSNILNIRSYEIIGTSQFYEPSNFIYQNNQALKELFKEISNLRLPLILQRIPISLPVKDYIKNFGLTGNLIIEKPVIGSQYVNLPQSVEEFEGHLKSKRRSDLRRYTSKAKKQGELEIQIQYPTDENINSIIQTAFEVEHASWKSETRTSILSRSNTEKFFRYYFNEQSTHKKLVVGFLKINGTVAAMQIAVISSNRLWLIKIGQNDQYKNLAPGIILTHEMIKHSIIKGLEKVEFMGSCEQWLRLWKPHVHHYKACLIYPLNLSGLIHFTKDTISIILNKLIK